jgi:hypothetical protein
MPFGMYHTGRLARWCIRHYRVTAVTVAFLWAWSRFGFQGAVIRAAVLVVMGLTAWVAWRCRGAEGAAPTPRELWEDAQQKHVIRAQWPLACEAAELTAKRTGPPALRRLRGNGHGSFTAEVRCGEVGVPVFKFQAKTEFLKEVIGCAEVTVTPTGSGVGRFAFHFRDPIGRVLPLAAMPPASLGSRGDTRLAYGIRQDGTPATIIANQSVLIGGLTRMGKSNICWALLADCIRQGLPVEIYVSDPKEGLELQEFERAMREAEAAKGNVLPLHRLITVREYAPTVAATIEMIGHAEKAMKARKHHMKLDGVRKLEKASEKYPLVVVLLDETVALQAILTKGQDSPLGRIAYMGAAAWYVVWMNTQAAQLDVLGRVRSFIPQRICVATDAPQTTDAVLGGYAESKGALCSEVQEPGVGWSDAEGERRPAKFRAAEVTDAEVKLIARGELPRNVERAHQEATDARSERAVRDTAPRRTALYRWFHADANPEVDRPGYIGISFDILRRESQHTAALREFMEGDVQRTVEWFDTRKLAEAAEKRAIETENPIYNKVHNGRNAHRRIELPAARRRRQAEAEESREKLDA